MTNVKIIKKDDTISYIEIKGHALSAQYGHDVVCAGISTVVFGICNALEELTDYDESQIIFEDGLIAIPNILDNETVQLICKVLIVELKTIHQSYPKYIEISYQ